MEEVGRENEGEAGSGGEKTGKGGMMAIGPKMGERHESTPLRLKKGKC